MKNKRLINLLFLLLIITFISCSIKKNSSIKIIDTKLIDSVTTNNLPKNFYFNKIKDAVFYNNYIFILDGGSNVIYKFDSNKNFISKISKKGKGPGELLNPENLVVKANKIYVSSRTLRKIIIYNLNGKFLNDINVDVKLNFDVDSKGNIYVPNVDKNFIITEYNVKGKVLVKFGKKFEFNNSLLNYLKNFTNIYIDKYDNSYLVFFEYPIIRKYSKSRKLLWEKNLRNIKWIKNEYIKIGIKEKKGNFGLNGLFINGGVTRKYLVINPVGRRDKTYDLLIVDINSGKFIGYLDIKENVIPEKYTFNNNKFYEIDFRNIIYIYETK